jgi:predicted dehydrogenase
VVLATPDALHAPQATAALNAGKAVVVDKPFATSAWLTPRPLVALAEDKGLLLSVFQNRRWDADFLALQADIASGRLGRIVTFESRYDRTVRWSATAGARADGAGVWFDLGPHLVDQILVLFGRPLGVSCDMAIQRDGGLSPDWAPRRRCAMTDGRRVVLNAAMIAAAPDVRFIVHGSKGSWLKSGPRRAGRPVEIGHGVGRARLGRRSPPPTFVDGETGDRTSGPGPAGDYPAYYSAWPGPCAARAPTR